MPASSRGTAAAISRPPPAVLTRAAHAGRPRPWRGPPSRGRHRAHPPAAAVLDERLSMQRAVERSRPGHRHRERRPRPMRRSRAKLEAGNRQPLRRCFAGEGDHRIGALDVAPPPGREPDRKCLFESAPELGVPRDAPGGTVATTRGGSKPPDTPSPRDLGGPTRGFRISFPPSGFVCAARPGLSGASRGTPPGGDVASRDRLGA